MATNGSAKADGRYAADRLAKVQLSGIRRVNDKVHELEAAGRDVIHWQIGRPDFDTPEHIKDATIAALKRGEVHYAPNNGIPALRKAIAARTELDTGVPVDGMKQAIVFAGANEAIMASALALINPGDEVLIADPNWPNYRHIITLVGGVPVEVPTRGEDDFQLDAAEVEKRITPKTRALCITSPGNPTGAVQKLETLEALARVAIKHDLLVFSDEIYARIFYGQGRVSPSIYSIPGMPERTVIINGFSKTYSMDGWRLGWTVASEEITKAIYKARQYTTVCVNTFIQHGAVAALSADQKCVDDMVAEFRKRRTIMLEGLRAIEGVTVPDPQGAFYVFADVSSFGKKSSELADWLIEEHGIAAVTGSIFGTSGEGYLRMAYSCSTDECARGMARLKTALDSLRK
ncbi:MAG TPA: pyridoxal phosphate-dependent aminotransferase [Spirochaetales bacterium]|nr:pyridoxal phosphate-dependent aminotransferase [Spirochaetales bacterium]